MPPKSDFLPRPDVVDNARSPAPPLRGVLESSQVAVEAAFADLMSFVPVRERAWSDLWHRMTDPERHYHNAHHLRDLWQLHCRSGDAEGFGSRRSTVLVASAIAFHDAVYVAGRKDNEERSADLWLKASHGGTMHDIDRLWVAETIRATSDHLASEGQSDGDLSSRLRQWFLDLDISSLGASPEIFEDNTRRLREEASSLPDDVWQSALLGFMSRLDGSPSIYRSATIRDLFEDQARTNIRACLEKIHKNSARL